MKKIILILFCILMVTDLSFSQKRMMMKGRRTHFWSFSIDGGVTVPVGYFSDTYKTSGNAGIELAYHPNSNTAVFADGQYNFLTNNDSSTSITTRLLETTLGGRIYFGRNNAKFFIEASFGDYFLRYNNSSQFAVSNTYTYSYFGISGGIGCDIIVSRRISFFLKAKYNTIFTPVNNSSYAGVYSGIRFIF